MSRPGLAALLLTACTAGCAFWRPAFPETVPIEHAWASSGALRAGAAAVDVTPAEPVWMGGYAPWRRSEGVHDPLYARALVLERGALRLALVAVDVVGLQRGTLLPLHERFRAAGFDPRHVVVASTHNHSGPDSVGLWGLPPFYSGRSDAAMRRLEDGIVAALERASAALRPAELAAVGVPIDPAGVMKNLRRPGMVDAELVVLHVRAMGGGETVATLVELGCHPEVLGNENRLLTADFPGWTVARLEKALGGVGLYVSGALGGLVTPDVQGGHPDGEGGSYLEAQRVGERVAEAALGALAGPGRYQRAPHLAAWHAPLFLPNRNFRYDLVRWTGVLKRRLYRGGFLRTEVNVWELGALRIATVPGEITPDLGLRIKRVVGGRPTLLVGLANDELGYLLPEAEFELPIYDYERTLSPGRDAGERILRRLEDVGLLIDAASPSTSSR